MLRDANYRGYVVLEYESSPDPYEAIPKHLAELRNAIARFYDSSLGLAYPTETVIVASGARPVLYGTWRLFVEPGDRTLSFVPAWNAGYYADLTGAQHTFIATTPETNFHPAPLPERALSVRQMPPPAAAAQARQPWPLLQTDSMARPVIRPEVVIAAPLNVRMLGKAALLGPINVH